MSVRLQKKAGLATLSIDRPAKRGAFNLAMWHELARLLADAAADPSLRAMVVRSGDEGGAFCAGADIEELLANAGDAGWRAEFQTAINHAQATLARHRLPTIAFIEGDCIGAGCGLALACDFRLATPKARFGITPAKLGLTYPLHDVKLLVDLVGPGQARRILFTAQLFDAQEALRIGLIEQIAQSPDATIEALMRASSHSIALSKRFVQRVLDGEGIDDQASLDAFTNAFDQLDFAVGAAAFLGKRRPRYND